MNAWYSRVDKPQRPDFVVFDLDPPETNDGFSRAIEVALLVRGALQEIGLDGWPKTSGAGGMHVLAPIERRATFGQAHELAERLTRLLAARPPGGGTPPGRRHRRVAQGKAPGRLHRLPPERRRQDDRVGLLGEAQGGCARFDA